MNVNAKRNKFRGLQKHMESLGIKKGDYPSMVRMKLAPEFAKVSQATLIATICRMPTGTSVNTGKSKLTITSDLVTKEVILGKDGKAFYLSMDDVALLKRVLP